MSNISQAIQPSLAVADVRRTSSPGGTALAGAAIVLVATYLAAAFGGRQAALFLVGIGAGLVLYHAAFGFTSSWRVFIADGRGAGLRAQMLMLAATCLVFFPLLAAGELFGQPLRGSISPVGIPVVAGAFLFGVGMQLGGGCASGTLYTVGGGNTRMVVTLLAFIAGSVIGTAHAPWWTAQPSFPPMSLVTLYGPSAALALSLALFGAIAAFTAIVERRLHPQRSAPSAAVASSVSSAPSAAASQSASSAARSGSSSSAARPRLWTSAAVRGPWPLVAGALGLALVNIATLVLAGRPWGVTSAFALWGAKALMAIGVPVQSWPYWSAPAQKAALEASVMADVTTVMNAGIVLGALAAAMLAGRFSPAWRASGRSLAAALVGGLLLGYGARVAYGCNIGAYFSGVASGSVHGWLWLVAAFAGNALGVRLRPMCDLPVESRYGKRPIQKTRPS